MSFFPNIFPVSGPMCVSAGLSSSPGAPVLSWLCAVWGERAVMRDGPHTGPGQSWPGEWRVARCVSHSATRRQSSWPPSPWALTPAGSTTGDTRYIYFQNVARINS